MCYIIIFLLKRAYPFISTNLNSLHPRRLCVMFGWNWLSHSADFSNSVNVFPLFPYISPEKNVVLHLINFNSLHQSMPCAKFGWNPVKRRWKCEKFTTPTTTDNRQISIRKAHLSFGFGELKSQNSSAIRSYNKLHIPLRHFRSIFMTTG